MFGYSEEEIPGQVVRIYCEANPDYYLTAREYDDVVLAPRDESNPNQQWIMDETWGIRIKDSAGFPAFALVNKGIRKALKHGVEENEKVILSPYLKGEMNEAVLWTQSADVGNGYKCIRPVHNIDLNLDAHHGDSEGGGIRDGTDVILFKWKKQENQKWKIHPISNINPQAQVLGESGTWAGSSTQAYGGLTYGEGLRCGSTPSDSYVPHIEDASVALGVNYEEATTYPMHQPHRPFPDSMPKGQSVRIYCEQNPDFFLTNHDGDVVLAPGDENDVTQQWIKVDEWGTRIRDEANFPAFALVSKATLKALKHGTQEWDKVGLSYYNDNELDESVLWTQSADVGHGYQCIRPVTNIHLNLDAKLADGKYGNIEHGNELILFRWKKQKNQKWKMMQVY
eukprot:TRINITY_DN2781_c0_g1_i1.p1 TRINITY_DN2781_c0_g1~~TRINITY_DN2781_c0_g1_i1.p1  ORF type:complete len:396 (-),score=100.20 TRINITY_DN2781_c0_g1_i1:431-1618(-)